jgi:hypothetical protein
MAAKGARTPVVGQVQTIVLVRDCVGVNKKDRYDCLFYIGVYRIAEMNGTGSSR